MYLSVVNIADIDKASKVLDEALEKIKISDINKSAIVRLKNGLEAQGQTLKYDINNFKKKVHYYLRYF